MGDRSDRRLMVNMIPFSATQEQMQGLFGPFGELEELRVIVDPRTNQNKGYGFVTYTTAEAANAAMAQLNNHLMPGATKAFKIHLADKPPPGTNKPVPNGSQCYIAGFSTENWNTVLAMMARVGQVVSSKQIPPQPGMKSVGFVDFSDPSSVPQAVGQYNNQCVEGTSEVLTVRTSNKAKDGGRGRGGPRGPGGPGDRFHPYGGRGRGPPPRGPPPSHHYPPAHYGHPPPPPAHGHYAPPPPHGHYAPPPAPAPAAAYYPPPAAPEAYPPPAHYAAPPPAAPAPAPAPAPSAYYPPPAPVAYGAPPAATGYEAAPPAAPTYAQPYY